MSLLSSALIWLVAITLAGALLIAGEMCRRRYLILKRLHLPGSILAGVVGWFLLNRMSHFDFLQGSQGFSVERLASLLRSWPGWLIALVFAGMLLPRHVGRATEGRVSRVGREGLMVWVIVLGQSLVGLTVTWLIIQPLYGVPDSFGMLIETGFAGGHGTAAAMGQVLIHPAINLKGATDLGVLVATVGLLYGLVSGVFWVNLGVRKGWLSTKAAATQSSLARDVASEADESDAARGNLLFAGLLLLIASTIGWLLHDGAIQVGAWSDSLFQSADVESGDVSGLVGSNLSLSPADSREGGARRVMEDAGQAELDERLGWSAVIGSFPLFIFTLFGGLLLRQLLIWLGCDARIEREPIQRITRWAMDLLVFAAIATLNLKVVETFLGPLLILLVAGFLWTGFCLLFLSSRLLPRDHWFELGLINYGMSTGTTATGFVLLRLVDPKLQSGAAEDYALAAPLSSPFIGGGMLTIGLPLLILERVPIASVCVVLFAVVFACGMIGWIWNHRIGSRSGDL